MLIQDKMVFTTDDSVRKFSLSFPEDGKKELFF